MSQTTDPPAPPLPAALRLGAVHLHVGDLARSLAFYERSIGLRLHDHGAGVATLGDGTEAVLVLHEDRASRPAARSAGLYHVALLYPTREELARAVLRLSATGTEIQGASDHETHEAIYLADPDGNGLELAADRPREAWPEHLGYAAGPKALAFDALMATVDGEAPASRVREGLRTGHLHLHVGDVERALGFYRDLLGFEVQAHLGSAAFVSAGGYHHHLAVNVWRGQGVGPPAPHTVGLHHWTIRLPAAADVEALHRRLADAGVATEEVAGGFLVRDPWSAALAVVS